MKITELRKILTVFYENEDYNVLMSEISRNKKLYLKISVCDDNDITKVRVF